MNLMPRIAAMILLIPLAIGCSSMLRPKSPEPAFYQLEYPSTKVDCSNSFNGGVRVWNFTTAPPYDRTQMVVRAPDREVMFSRNYQWAALPGTMLTKRIQNDLEKEKLFSGGVVQAGLANVPWELSGKVETFACQRTDSSCKAILGVDVSLNSTSPGGEKIFQKNYRFTSEPFSKDDSAKFAAAMSGIARQFSEQLQKDLCQAAGKNGQRQ